MSLSWSAAADPRAWAFASCASAWFMAGLIWFVHVVHYPLFDRVGPEGFPDYHREHSRRTTLVVAPVMLLELLAASVLAALLLPRRPDAPLLALLALLNLALVLAVWASTFLVQVPLHDRLARGPDPALVERLVRTNALRVLLWTARAPIASWIVLRLAAPQNA